MQGDDVGCRRELAGCGVAHAHLDQLRPLLEVVGQHLAGEALAHDPGHDGADRTGADHAHRPAVQVEAQEPVEGEVVVAGADIGAVDAAVEAEDQADRELRHRVWRVGGHADDLDPELTGRTQVDIVEAGTAQRHEPGAAGSQSLQGCPVELVVDEDAHTGKALGKARRLRREPRLEEAKLMAVRRIRRLEELAVVGLGAEDGDPHDASSPASVESSLAPRPGTRPLRWAHQRR